IATTDETDLRARPEVCPCFIGYFAIEAAIGQCDGKAIVRRCNSSQHRAPLINADRIPGFVWKGSWKHPHDMSGDSTRSARDGEVRDRGRIPCTRIERDVSAVVVRAKYCFPGHRRFHC